MKLIFYWTNYFYNEETIYLYERESGECMCLSNVSGESQVRSGMSSESHVCELSESKFKLQHK
jgi:hypothetical protein